MGNAEYMGDVSALRGQQRSTWTVSVKN